MVLENNLFISYKEETPQTDSTEIFDLTNCIDIVTRPNSNEFYLVFPAETRRFVAASSEELNQWFDIIGECLGNKQKQSYKYMDVYSTFASVQLQSNRMSCCKSARYCQNISRVFGLLSCYYTAQFNENELAKQLIKYENLIQDYYHILLNHLHSDMECKDVRNKNCKIIYQIMCENQMFCDINKCVINVEIERENLSICMDIINSIQFYIVYYSNWMNIRNGTNDNFVVKATQIFCDGKNNYNSVRVTSNTVCLTTKLITTWNGHKLVDNSNTQSKLTNTHSQSKKTATNNQQHIT